MHLPVYVVSMERDNEVRRLPRLSEIIFSLSDGFSFFQSLIRECQKKKKNTLYLEMALISLQTFHFFKIYSLFPAHLKT